jgi:hypothetical protein
MKKPAVLVVLLLILSTILISSAAEAKPKAFPQIDWKMEPEVLLSSDSATLTLTLTNGAKPEEKDGGLLGGLLPSVPASPASTYIQRIYLSSKDERIKVFSPTYERIGELAPGQSLSFSFRIKVAENASDGVYYLKLWAHLSNADDLRYLIPIEIDNKQKPDLFATGIGNEFSQAIGAYKLTGEINNAGLKNATNVVVKLSGVKGIQPTVPYETYFVGFLESNDFSSFELDYRLKKVELSAESKLLIYIEYKDEDGRTFSKEEELNLSALGINISALPKAKQKEGSSLLIIGITIIVAVVIIGIIAYSWKSYKRK